MRLKPRQKEGSAEFWYSHYSSQWATDESFYRFPVYERPEKGIKVKAAKLPNGTIEIIAEGPLGRRFEFTHAIPPCDVRGVHIVPHNCAV